MKRPYALIVSVLVFTALMSNVGPMAGQTADPKEPKPQQKKEATDGPASPWQCDKGGPPSMTSSGDTLYWTDFSAGKVWKVSVKGGNSTLVAEKQSGPCSIVAHDNHIYWTNNTSGEVMKASINGGQATAVSKGGNRPAEIVVSEGRIIWASANGPQTMDTTTGKVMKAAGDSNAGGGTNPGTVKCHVCPIYCRRWVPQIPRGYWETYICGWRSCPPCGA